MLSLTLIGLTFFACEDQYADQEVAEPTMYEQEATQSTDFQAEVKTNPLTIAQGDIGNSFEFISITSVPDLVDTAATAQYAVIISNEESFTTYAAIVITQDNAALYVEYEKLNDELKTLNGTSDTHTAYARVLAYIVSGGTKVLYTTESLPFDVTTFNYPPVAVNDTVTAVKNQQLAYDVLANDSDPEGGDLTLVSAQGASNGTATVSGDSILYTPNTDYTGTDEVTYTVSDGNSTSTAIVVITVIEKAAITQFWVVGSYNGWDNSDNASFILSTESSNGLAEGYVYLTAGEIKLVTDHSWDDAHTFGDDGSGKLTNPGSNIAVAEDGYYLIHANLSDMTYSLLKTEWGVIGSASPGGWDDETALAFNAELKQWIGGIHLTAAEIKFRANHDWAYNYGSDNADGTLQSGGANIPVDLESDYAVTLDLSTPNVYTYILNRWGLIGSATPGGWDSDQNMTWDATNSVFTITLDLTAGEVKYRANDGWDVNLGGELTALTSGGANIAISEAGSYTITLDPWGLVGSVTKN